MKKYNIHFEDTFSFCKESHIVEFTTVQLNDAIDKMNNKTIVASQFKNAIRYNWIIKAIDLLPN